MEEIKVGMPTKEFVENLEVFNNSGEHINNPKAGDYIRTIDGYIRRIAKVNTERKAITYSGTYILDKPYKNSKSVARNKIKKFSQDIFDLIKENDAIKFWYEKETICNVYKTSNGNLCVWNGFEDVPIKHIHIKSIITKEQFENKEYRLED